MKPLEELQLFVIVKYMPELESFVNRYKMICELYPDALYEFDEALRKRGLFRADTLEDPQMKFLKRGIEILEDEIRSLESIFRQAQQRIEHESLWDQ